MYGANGDRRKYQDASKNYGRRQSDYEQHYNRLRQQRDNEANNHNHNQHSSYHQNNISYGNDSYFGAQSGSAFQYSQYGEHNYGDVLKDYQDQNYGSMSTDYSSDSNQYNNQSQYDKSQYSGTQYGANEYSSQYDNQYSNMYSGTQYGEDQYSNQYNAGKSYSEANYSYADTGYTSYGQQQNNYSQYQSNTQYGDNEFEDNKRFTQYDVGDSTNLKSDISALHPGKSHPIRNIVFRVLLVAFLGVVLGEACRTVFNEFWNEHIFHKNMFILIVRMLGVVVVMFASYLLHIILHEFGHLVGGTLSGYSLISFRVFNIIMVKEKNKMKIKKYAVADTAGECVMMPPEIKKGKYPYVLFRVSGIAMNLFTAIIAIILLVVVNPIGKYPWNMWCVIYAVVGIITSLYNGIPVIIDGIPNDGYVMLHMLESKEARLAVHSQLLIYAFLSKGGSYSDVPYEQFCFNSTGEIRNFLVIKVKMLEYKWHLEHLDFVQAAKCLEATNQFFNSLPRSQQYEINSEKMFIEILCEKDEDIISKLYNSDVRKYIEDSQDTLTKNRILMAYNAGVKKDMREAHKNYMQLKSGAKAAPIKGETELQLMLGEYVYDKFCNGQ